MSQPQWIEATDLSARVEPGEEHTLELLTAQITKDCGYTMVLLRMRTRTVGQNPLDQGTDHGDKKKVRTSDPRYLKTNGPLIQI